MAVIEILQKIRGEVERMLGQLNSGSSRFYEITTAGTIVERTHQLRDFYEFVARHLEQAASLLGAGGKRPRD